MRRQISRAILGVAVLLVLGLGVPLAVVVQRFYEDRARGDLERRAAETITELTLPFDRAELATVADERDSPGIFTVYDASGRRVFGPGPALADVVVRRALRRGRPFSAIGDEELVVASPVTDRTSERIVGAVRVAEPSTVVDGDVHRAWLAMLAAVAVALAAAAALARVQGRRLAEPVAQLAAHAEDLGRGAFVIEATPSGIAEIDAVAAAMTSSGERLASLLARERAFSADVAHQLRTPLTRLRLTLERLARESPTADLPALLGDVDRLSATVDHLLALARDRQPVAEAVDVDGVLGRVESTWAEAVRSQGRTLVIERESTNADAVGSAVSIGQALDVLIDNALRHGDGTITVRSRSTTGGRVIEVSDEGSGVGDDDVFRRRDGEDGHGIGLALARSIIEADGGRLQLAAERPPCFQIILPKATTPAPRSPAI